MILLINKSDTTGGAAVVSRRLMEAFRQQGIDARMLVAEKLSDSPYVEKAADNLRIKGTFLAERLGIFLANGFNRETLFKIDTGNFGLPLWRHPLVKKADAILLNWVNQGVLSLKGVDKILKLGKPLIWTMHDMWNITGICHHAAKCRRFLKECGDCPLLGKKGSSNDLSYKIWEQKKNLYSGTAFNKNPITFVPVSNWLKEKGLESSLLKDKKMTVIPNAFPIAGNRLLKTSPKDGRIRILFGAARLDDSIKGLSTLKEMSAVLRQTCPELASKMEIALFGNIKNPEVLKDFSVPIIKLGVLKGEKEVRKAYYDSQITVSASSYETLPGTLVEAQAYGCIPVAFNQGGQPDIVVAGKTGFLAEYDENIEVRATNLAEKVAMAAEVVADEQRYKTMLDEMFLSVTEKFSYKNIAYKYLQLIEDMKRND